MYTTFMSSTTTSTGTGLYIHIPFCRRRCSYCSFVSVAHREGDMPAYLNTLGQELTRYADGQRISTIYFGGGTPSLLSVEQIEHLSHTIHSLFNVDGNAEITMEANPGTIDIAYLKAIKESGINRLSLGIQSLNDKDLKILGRIHTAAEARDAVFFARKAGFNNLSLDLIYGLPGQTLTGWRNVLKEAADLAPEHLSLYPLTLEGEEPMSRLIARGELPEPDPDCCADQYELAEDLLAEYGYHHYEISNWAKQGWECRHNMVYWQDNPYLGAGVAAHSYLNRRRFANTTDIDDYLKADKDDLPSEMAIDEEVRTELQCAEAVILGLRLCDGICPNDIDKRYNIDLLEKYSIQIEELRALGLLEFINGYIRLTRRGRLLGNEVFHRFLPD